MVAKGYNMDNKETALAVIEAAAIITGLSFETVRQYGKTGYFPTFKYPGKNLYPCKE